MKNILDYVKETGRISFAEKPFCQVDSLIISELSYFKYEGLVRGPGEDREGTGMKEISHRGDFEKMFLGLLDIPANQALLLAVANSVRFGNMKLNYYVNQIELERETQFSAVTFFMEEGNTYLAYRGTDENLIGWKEDFNMGFLSPVPAQEAALYYLRQVAPCIRGDFYMGGHSKGGNVAVYAGLKAEPDIQSRIRGIFSHDGPGFLDAVFEERGYRNIQGKIHKIIPQSSLVGLLFQHQEVHQVVKSSESGLLQHDPFSWIVDGDDFVYLEDVDKRALFMDKTLNAWIVNMEDEVRKSFVDAVFNILSATEAVTVVELSEEWGKGVMSVLAATKEIDEESRQIIKQTISLLMKVGKESIRELREKGKENREDSFKKTAEKNRKAWQRMQNVLAGRLRKNKVTKEKTQ